MIEARFTGTVRRVGHLGNHEGTVIVAHFDPRFVVEVDIQTVVPIGMGIEPGLAYFAIHSPALLFGIVGLFEVEGSVGKTFRFMLKGEDSCPFLSVIEIVNL